MNQGEAQLPKQMEGDCDCFSVFRRWAEEELKSEASTNKLKQTLEAFLSQMLRHPHAVNESRCFIDC